MNRSWSAHLIESFALEPWTVHAVQDARFRADGGVAFSMVPRSLWEREVQAVDGNSIPLRVGVLLLERPGVRLVIDTGFGAEAVPRNISGFFGGLSATQGLDRALETLAWDPDSVTHLLLTHLHVDHAGGSFTPEGAPRFPRASVTVATRELEYALDPHPLRGPVYDGRAARLLAASERLQPIGHLPEMILPDVEVRLLGGHSPGQLAVIIHGASRSLLVPGDVLPTRAHRRPRWVLSYDQDPSQVYDVRRSLVRRARALGWLVHFGHDPLVPFGRILPGGDVETVPIIGQGLAAGG
ncbi:MAG: beta-lactamase domain-containing protein [bacterium]|nr:MAG: beta-lactamase domain-containing protein [bacterium]